jgi:hypothetical protein
LLLAAAGLAACGSSSPSSSPAGSSSPTAARPTATGTPPTTSAGGFAANLTFTGTLAGSTTQAKAPSGTQACGNGSLIVVVTLNGQDYKLIVLNTVYKGPGKYTLGGISSGTVVLFTDSESGGKSSYTSTSGALTYGTEKSITIDGDLTGSSASQRVHVSGSAGCA